MTEYTIINGELYHHGVKGQKWGVRRYQNKDGSLTPEGRKRYDSDVTDLAEKKKAYKSAGKAFNKSYSKAYNRSLSAYSPFKKHREANKARWDDVADKVDKYNEAKTAYKTAKKDFKQSGAASVKKMLAKEEKRQYKDFVKTRSKEILAGESAAARLYDRYTGAHKTAAKLEWYDRKHND